jgi:AcrR family transcriptional regulator
VRLHRESEQTGGIQPVHSGPAVGPVTDVARDPLVAGDADQRRHEAVVSIAVVGRRESHHGRAHAARGEVKGHLRIARADRWTAPKVRCGRVQIRHVPFGGQATGRDPECPGGDQERAIRTYGERGFENTIVAEIAARVGLTERTFFRHFADKREVLFSGADALQELLVSNVAAAPDSVAPIDVVGAALEAAGGLFQERREFARQRAAIIAANAELRERELIKLASLASAIAGALRQRGVADPSASLSAEAGIAVFRIAFEQWVEETNQRDLSELIRESLDELKAVTAGK